MEFSSSRQADLSEEDQMGKVQLHFSFSSTSSSSLHPLTGNPISWEHQHQMGCCSASAIKCDASEEEEAASTRLDLMDTSPRNNHDDVRSATATTHIQKEHMFDKVVTPSDVGKLNRLVIPKQHAEKFFPLDSSSNEKGLLLNFEDRNGKPWRFRYSYWNSSQSYVMTKGWSRFVKDKKLDAGDIVSFQRGVGELGKDRLYIDWRRRPDAPEPTPAFPLQHHLSFHRPIPAWSPLLMRPQVTGMARERDHSYHLSQTNNYLNRNSYYNGGHGSGSGGVGVINPAACSMGSILYLRSQPAASVVEPQQQVQMGMGTGMGMVEWRRQQHHHQHPMVFDSVPVVQGKAAAKRLRLFGVNMECPMTESDDECDILSSTTIQHLPTITIQQQPSSSSSQLPPIDFLNKGKASMSFDHKF